MIAVGGVADTFVLAFVNGLAFGPLRGTLLTIGSATLAAAISFGIARALGRPVAQAVVGEAALRPADCVFSRWGARAVLVAHLLPIISFDGHWSTGDTALDA